MAEFEQFDDEERSIPTTRHCAEHSGYGEAIKGIEEKLNVKLNVLIGIATLLTLSVISFGTYLTSKTTSQSERLSLFEYKQNQVIENAQQLRNRMDVFERYINKQP